MTRNEEERLVGRLRLAFEMFTLGVSMMRHKIRRSQPDASQAAVEEKLATWLRSRPGAESGDAPGIVRCRPQ